MLKKIQKFNLLTTSRKLEFIYFLYRKLHTAVFYTFRFKSLGAGSFLIRPLMITPEFITLGKNVSFRQDARIEAIESFSGQLFKPHIIIEDGVTFQQRCHITAASDLFIGKNTIASFDVMITDIDHEYQNINLPIGAQTLIIKKTYIGDNCFIGGGAKIQAGTRLGKHCVVGANAVVRGEFPDYCVIVGMPAKVIKRYNGETGLWQKTDRDGNFLVA